MRLDMRFFTDLSQLFMPGAPCLVSEMLVRRMLNHMTTRKTLSSGSPNLASVDTRLATVKPKTFRQRISPRKMAGGR